MGSLLRMLGAVSSAVGCNLGNGRQGIGCLRGKGRGKRICGEHIRVEVDVWYVLIVLVNTIGCGTGITSAVRAGDARERAAYEKTCKKIVVNRMVKLERLDG